jgi:hypothetical protein
MWKYGNFTEVLSIYFAANHDTIKLNDVKRKAWPIFVFPSKW